jgi:hypothetical protein
LRGFFRKTAQFADAPEKQHSYTNCGRDGWHLKIVT